MPEATPAPFRTDLPSSTDSLRACVNRMPALWRDLEEHPERFRVLTGDRPTGRLHVGHYFGSLQNRVRLQNMGVEMYILVADYQVVTDRNETSRIRDSVLELMLDYLAIGIEPERATIFCHSMIPALNQLMLPFLSVMTMSELQRNPTVKEEIELSGTRSVSGLMMTYPVHQAADILFCHGNLVPGGKDQLPHVEVARLVARRMNALYFGGEPYFPEPELLLSQAPMLLGIDGRKMGKSLDNAIYLGSTEDETARLVKRAKTDSERNVTYDPENRPELANLLLLCALCTGEDPADIAASIGDQGAAALKARVTDSVNEYFAPIRARRAELAKDAGAVMGVLRDGVERATAVANATLDRVRAAMGMDYFDEVRATPPRG
jgi:tryptophanyl-tRNA synthetase